MKYKTRQRIPTPHFDGHTLITSLRDAERITDPLKPGAIANEAAASAEHPQAKSLATQTGETIPSREGLSAALPTGNPLETESIHQLLAIILS